MEELKVYSIVEIVNTDSIRKKIIAYLDEVGIYLDLEYLAINDIHESGETYVALLVDGNRWISYPFIKRSFQYKGKTYADITTPYEYGGECAYHNDKELLYSFRQRFNQYCIEQNILTEFQRIDPFSILHFDDDDNAEYLKVKENVVIDLEQSEDNIFSNYHKNNRRDIRLAKRNLVKVKRNAPSKSVVNEFKELYYSTMDAKNTTDYYYFNEDYFKALSAISEDKMDVYTAHTEEGVLASAALVLKKNRIAHYHLSGTNRSYTKLCATNLMLHEMAIHLKKEGYSYFHLGGAASSQEGLYRFKSKFSNDRKDYYVCKRIFDTKVYDELNQQIIKDKELYNQTIDKGFFPLYRKLIEIT